MLKLNKLEAATKIFPFLSMGLGLVFSLSGIISVLPLSAQAEELLIPRLGFSIYQDKLVRVVRHQATPKSTDATEKPAEISPEASETTPSDSTETAVASDPSSKEAKEALKAAKEAAEKLKKEQKTTERAHKRELKALKKENKNGVAGEFYLYSLKNKRILYGAQGTSLETGHGTIKRDHESVVFKDPVAEGLYNIAVQGSGHLSDSPLWVSDSIYWEAIKPVVKDIAQGHCPHQKGKFEALQFCYALKLANETGQNQLLREDRYIKGGWFINDANQSNTSFNRKVKDTAEIAKITNLLLNLYAMNPESYKYLELDGVIYKETETPDILDEVNWGLQFLQTAQNTNGALPEGIEQPFEFRQEYKLLPDSTEATALGISALTQASKVYKDSNLSYAVSLILTAEKAWTYLQQNSTPAAYQYLAAQSLADATGKASYQDEANRLTGAEASLSRELTLLLGRRGPQANQTTEAVTAPSQELSASELPQSESPQVENLAYQLETKPSLETLRWASSELQNMYGYENTKFTPAIDYKLESAWRDPLAYLAYKTGERITKLSYGLEDKKVMSRDKKDLSSEFLKELEEKEAKAKALSRKGYKTLNLSTLEKAYLAYTLGLVNEGLPLWEGSKVKHRKSNKKSQPRAEEVDSTITDSVDETTKTETTEDPVTP